MSMVFSMAAFALASSISPGPVNLVALGAGARYGLRASLRHVTGATVGFTVLLLLIGLGLRQLVGRWPPLLAAIQWGGAAFLLFMAWRLATADGRLVAGDHRRAPSLLYGAVMQWLNPKAWLAALAGMGAYAAEGAEGAGGAGAVWQFAAIYFVICYASIACWAYAGSFLRRHLDDARRVRGFNRLLALLLLASVVYMLSA